MLCEYCGKFHFLSDFPNLPLAKCKGCKAGSIIFKLTQQLAKERR